MRADSKPQPPSPLGRRRHQPAGRPRYYEPQDLMEVWLFGEEQRAQYGWSVNRACQAGRFTCHVMGRPGGIISAAAVNLAAATLSVGGDEAAGAVSEARTRDQPS